MWKRSTRRSSVPSTKTPKALLWCHLFRPQLGSGCVLVVLCATFFVAAIIYNNGFAAWSPKNVAPKGAHQNAGLDVDGRSTTLNLKPTHSSRNFDHADDPGVKKIIRKRHHRKGPLVQRVQLATAEGPHEIEEPLATVDSPGDVDDSVEPEESPVASSRKSRHGKSRSADHLSHNVQEIMPEHAQDEEAEPPTTQTDETSTDTSTEDLGTKKITASREEFTNETTFDGYHLSSPADVATMSEPGDFSPTTSVTKQDASGEKKYADGTMSHKHQSSWPTAAGTMSESTDFFQATTLTEEPSSSPEDTEETAINEYPLSLTTDTGTILESTHGSQLTSSVEEITAMAEDTTETTSNEHHSSHATDAITMMETTHISQGSNLTEKTATSEADTTETVSDKYNSSQPTDSGTMLATTHIAQATNLTAETTARSEDTNETASDEYHSYRPTDDGTMLETTHMSQATNLTEETTLRKQESTETASTENDLSWTIEASTVLELTDMPQTNTSTDETTSRKKDRNDTVSTEYHSSRNTDTLTTSETTEMPLAITLTEDTPSSNLNRTETASTEHHSSLTTEGSTMLETMDIPQATSLADEATASREDTKETFSNEYHSSQTTHNLTMHKTTHKLEATTLTEVPPGSEYANKTTASEYHSSQPTEPESVWDTKTFSLATNFTQKTIASGVEYTNGTTSNERQPSRPTDVWTTPETTDFPHLTNLTEIITASIEEYRNRTTSTEYQSSLPTEAETMLEPTVFSHVTNYTEGTTESGEISSSGTTSTEHQSILPTYSRTTGLSQTTNFMKSTELSTTSETSNKSKTEMGANETIECNTAFCQAEAAHLKKIFESGRDPCNNFYQFACADWKEMSSDSQPYETADDALTGYVEEMARTVLNGNPTPGMEPLFNLWNACNQKGAVKDSQLKEILASFGLRLNDGGAVTETDVLRAAGSVLNKLDSAPLLSLDMTVNPANDTVKLLAVRAFSFFSVQFRNLAISPGYSGSNHIGGPNSATASTMRIALDDADILLSREEAMQSANTTLMSDLVCKFMKIFFEPGDLNDTLCDVIAHIAFRMAVTSSYDRTVSERMSFYAMMPYRRFAMFEQFFAMVDGTKNYTGSNAVVIGKNMAQLYLVKELVKTPGDALAYVTFHTAVYLSPFLEDKADFWEPAMALLTRHKRPHPVPKWRLCLRLVDRVLPGMLLVSFQSDESIGPLFSDLMADVIAEEVRSAFIDDIEELDRTDNYTRYILAFKAESIGMHSFFTAQNSINVFVNDTSGKVQAEVPWNNNPIEYFLGVSVYMARLWANHMRRPLVERRRGLSMFDTDCQFNPEENAVVFPLALFNFSVPTSAKERMFHIPRVGPRLSGCLLRATFSDNIYRPAEYLWTQHSESSFNSTAHCLASHYREKVEAASLHRIVEDSCGVIVSYETFQERLFTKQYLRQDYSFAGLPDAMADQLFFVYYAQSYCTRSDQATESMRKAIEDKVNVPLMNFPEFAESFKCKEGTPMNATRKCSFWSQGDSRAPPRRLQVERR